MEARPGSTQQFTVFYSGSINVFNHVPAHKAHAIMLLLSDHQGNNECNRSMDSSTQRHEPLLPRSGDVVGCAKASSPSACHPPTLTTFTANSPQITKFVKNQSQSIVGRRSQAELPFARKASLARFLEKRKDRVVEAVKTTDDGGKACADSDGQEAVGSPCKRTKP